MTKLEILAGVLALAIAAGPAAAWPSRTRTDADQLGALIDAGLPQVAAQLLPLCDVPRALADEVRVRAALDRADRREVERVLVGLPASPITALARAVLALDRGLPEQADRAAREGLELMAGRAERPLWELALLRVNALVAQGRVSNAAAQIFTMPEGPGKIPWSPYLMLVQMTGVDDRDRPRLVHEALRFDSYSPEARIQGIQQALADGDTDALVRHFFQHAYLRNKVVGRFLPRRGRRFPGLPVLPLYGPITDPPHTVVLAELARLAVWRDQPEQARRCQAMARSGGDMPTDARLNFARAALAMGDLGDARGNLEGLAPRERDAYSELASARAWNGEARAAMDALALAPRVRDREPMVQITRLRAQLDLDPAALGAALEAARAKLAVHPDYWAVAALAAHRRAEPAAESHALDQLVALRKMGRIHDVGCVRLALMLRELGRRDLRWDLLRPDGKPMGDSDFDGRPLAISALMYRLLADRAALANDSAAALQLLGKGAAAILSQVMGRLRLEPKDLDGGLIALVPRLGYDGWYPIAQVAARVHLQAGEAQRSLEQLLPFLRGSEPLTMAFFMLEAAALGSMGQREHTNAMAAAGTLLGARPGIAWGAYLQLLLVTGCEEAIHALARAARILQEPGDAMDDLVALFGLGGLYVEALTTPVPLPGHGTELGRGLAWAALGHDDDARRALSAAAAAGGAWAPPALLALVQLELRSGNLAGARAQLAEMERQKISDFRLETARALIALEQGDGDAAARAVESAKARGPDAWLPLVLSARIGKQKGTRARYDLGDASRVAPHEPRIWEEISASRWPSGQGGYELREAARQSLDSGQVARAVTALEHLVTRPSLPGRVRYPAADPGALAAAAQRLLHQPTGPYAGDAAGFDLAREIAMQLVELGHDTGALALAREAAKRDGFLAAPETASSGETAPLPREAAAVLMLTMLICLPSIAGRRLSAALRRA